MTEKLFSYGTFKDVQVQKKLFGRSLVMTDAVLEGWGVFVSQNGYLYVRQDDGSSVHGSVVELDKTELFKADQWEELPFYTREKLPVTTQGNGTEAVWVYTQRDGAGTRYNQDQVAALDHGLILAAVDKLNAQLLFSPLPFGDMHLILPCVCPDRESALPPESRGIRDLYLEAGETRARHYLSGRISGHLKHAYLETIELIARAPGTTIETGRQKLRSYILLEPEKGLAVVCLPLPACMVSPAHILAQMASGNLRVVRSGAMTEIPARDWLRGYGLEPAGNPDALILLSEMPAPGALERCLGSQVPEMHPDQSTASFFTGNPAGSWAQFGLMYASDTCLVTVPQPFRDTYEQRLSQAAFTLGAMECHAFRGASAKLAGVCPAGSGEGLLKTLLDFWRAGMA